MSRCTSAASDKSAYSEAFDSDTSGASLCESPDSNWTLHNEACLKDQLVTLEENLISFKRPLCVSCDPISLAQRDGEEQQDGVILWRSVVERLTRVMLRCLIQASYAFRSHTLSLLCHFQKTVFTLITWWNMWCHSECVYLVILQFYSHVSFIGEII